MTHKINLSGPQINDSKYTINQAFDLHFLNKPYPNQKQIAQKQDFKGQSLYFNHRISFDTKGPISPSSEGSFYIMVMLMHLRTM